MNLPKSSLLRLYDPATQGNSFSLDGFPALKEGKDFLTRLVEIVERQGALGMTTNQPIFRQLVDSGALDPRLKSLKAQGRSAGDIYSILYNEAATQSAGVFREVHALWPWEGRVSQEASAFLTELEPLVQDVQRISRNMQGVGAFTKIPNLRIGPQAIQRALAGQEPQVHPNITLVFSDRHYIQTVEATLMGLEARVENLEKCGNTPAQIREDISRIHSVNSLFVSRVDRVVDPMMGESFPLLKGKAAVAQAKKIYQIFEAIFLGHAFEDPEGLYADREGKALAATLSRLRELYGQLKQMGAHPQRLLIASTGVKSEQPYSPLLYVLPFLGPWSANTMPEGTLEAFSRFVAGLSDERVEAIKRRNIMREPLPAIPTDTQPSSKWDEAILMNPQERKGQGIKEISPDLILKELSDSVLKPKGTSLREICDTLRDKGAASFAADEQATLEAIQAKLKALSL